VRHEKNENNEKLFYIGADLCTGKDKRIIMSVKITIKIDEHENNTMRVITKIKGKNSSLSERLVSKRYWRVVSEAKALMESEADEVTE
jgi:hypothetical protein